MAEWQWKRWEAVARMGAGKLTMREAATILGLSVRQVRRVRRRLEVQGRQGLGHGNRARAPVNKLDAATAARIVQLRHAPYRDFNDQHFTEKLASEVPAIPVSVATVRRLLRRAGIGAVWHRRPRQHRRRRDRKVQAGLMLLWDGSRHDWLEGRGPWLCLVGAIDDATGELLPGAHFVAQECAAAYLRVLQAIATACGLPWSIYMDQHGALKRNDGHWTLAEELRGQQDPTQVGLALEALGIEAIKDNTVRLGGTVVLDIPPGPRRRSYADTRVEVRQLLDGSWRVYLADRLLASAPTTTLGELRTLRRHKRGRGAPHEAPQHAEYAAMP